jgi:peptidoglycan/xylan/chitin deacetylase (PgdA/CDA1 family)
MSRNKLCISFTMDCEQINDLAFQGGPATWELGDRAMRGYCSTLAEQGFQATLFVVTQAAHRYRSTLLDLHKDGVEVGLHYHPQDNGHDDFLGAYTAEEQEQMLSEAMQQWSDTLGFQPLVFRPGNFSANDATFPTLLRLGFLAGSVSLPQRNFIEARATWVGAPFDAHFAHPANRLLCGRMPFLNVPPTIDRESMVWGGRTPLDLRIELVDARAHGYTIRKALERQLDAGLQPLLCVYTHNIFDYGDPHEFRRQVLDGILVEIRRAAEQHELAMEPITLLDLRQRLLRDGAAFQG